MKKLVILAAFGVAGLVSANTTEVKVSKQQIEKVNIPFQLCGVHVNFYDSEGNLTGSQWFITEASTLSSCQAYQSMVKWNLTKMGFSIEAE